MRSAAPASTMARLLPSLLAAKLRRVEMAWHWISSFSSYARRSISGARKPDSMMGDSFAGWIETLRTQAAAERTSGRKDERRRRRSAGRPPCLTISTWYFSAGGRQHGRVSPPRPQQRPEGGRTIRGEVAESEGGLALDLEAGRVHEADQVGDEAGLALLEAAAVVRVDGDVAQRGGAVVLDIGVGAREKCDENRGRARGDELLPVVVGVGHVE